MVVPELVVLEKLQQESPPPAWPDKDDGTGGEKPISSAPRGRSPGKLVTLSCQAVIDRMHRQAGDAQRGRIFEAVDSQGGGEHESQERDWESSRLGGGLGPLRDRLREKENIIVYESKEKKARIAFIIWLCCRSGVSFGSWLGI